MNKSTRIFILNLIITLFLVFVVVICAGYFFNKDSMIDVSQKETVILVMNATDIPLEHLELIGIGDIIYFSDNEEKIGIIKDIKYEEKSVDLYNEQKQTNETYFYPDIINITFSVESQISSDNGKYSISDTLLTQEEEISVRVPQYEFTCEIIQISSLSNILNNTEAEDER